MDKTNEEEKPPVVERAKGPLARAMGLEPGGGSVDGLGPTGGENGEPPPAEKSTEEVIEESKLAPSFMDLLDRRSGQDDPPASKDGDPPSSEDGDPSSSEDGGPAAPEEEPDDFGVLGAKAEGQGGEGADDYDLPSPAADRRQGGSPRDLRGERREEPPFLADRDGKPEPVEMPEGLEPEHEERFELAQFAARFDPGKYGDLPKRYAEFFKAHQKFVDDKTLDDPDYDPSDDPEYEKFLRRNRPQLSAKEVRTLERESIKAEVREDVESRYKEDIEKLRNRLKKFEKSSEQNEKLQSFSAAARSALPEEVTGVIESDGEDAAREKFPHLMDMFDETLAHNQNLATAYYQLINGIEDLDFDGNPAHGELADYIDEVGHEFYENGGKRRIRNGKKFVPRSKFVELQKAGEADGYWTFSHDDVFKLLGRKTSKDFESRKKAEAARLRKWGYDVPWDKDDQGRGTGRKSPKVSSPRMPGKEAGGDLESEPKVNPAVSRVLGGGPRG